MNISILPSPMAYPLLLSEFICSITIIDDGLDGVQSVFMSLDGSEPTGAFNSPVQITAGTTVRVKVIDNSNLTTYATQAYPSTVAYNEPSILLKDINDVVKPLLVSSLDDSYLPLTVQISARMVSVDLFSFPNPAGWIGEFPYKSPLLCVNGKTKFLASFTSSADCTSSVALRLLDSTGKQVLGQPKDITCELLYPDYAASISVKKSIMQEYDTLGASYAGVVIYSTSSSDLQCNVAGV